METDSDSDEETQIHDIEQLTAVLEADGPDANALNEISSQCSTSSSQQSYPSKSLEYSKIQAALALNKLTDEKYRRLERILTSRLSECRHKLAEIQSINPVSEKQDRQAFRYVNCGRPYFRDQSNFPAPENDDTILMAKSGMYDFSQVASVPGWTVKDKSEFTSLLLTMTQEILTKNLNSKIAHLRRESKGKSNKKLEKEISLINQEIDRLQKKTLNEIALPLNEEYDWEMVATKLNRRHSAQEYRSLWKLFLHPSINKSSWSIAQHLALKTIAHKNNLQNWDKIAKELNTGRTGYQCFVYFRTNMSNTFTGQKWTKEEEEYLKRLIDYYREDDYIPWGKVASSMENRTKIQIYNKYNRLLEKRKGRFLPEEDAVILTCVENFGTNFKKMARFLPGRSATQLRVRYNVIAEKTRTSTVWTVEEDKKLIQIMANQDCHMNYSSLTEYFPGKNRVHLRARYLTLAKWMKKHPALDLSKAPRRGARRLCHGQASEDLNKAVENLKKRMQCEVENKKAKKVTKNSPNAVIGDGIIVTLVNENIGADELRKSELSDTDQSVLNEQCIPVTNAVNVTNLRELLTLLKAKLDKKTFEGSSYSKMYPNLANDHASCTFKVKSYSRKQTTKTILIKGAPDIWGTNVFGQTEYALPPNYATITGCRKLMAYVSANAQKIATPQGNLNTLIRRNILSKEQFNNFTERFCFMFLWPMLLSNESPVHRSERHVSIGRSLRDPEVEKHGRNESEDLNDME